MNLNEKRDNKITNKYSSNQETNQKNSWNNFIPGFEYESVRECTPEKFIR